MGILLGGLLAESPSWTYVSVRKITDQAPLSRVVPAVVPILVCVLRRAFCIVTNQTHQRRVLWRGVNLN